MTPPPACPPKVGPIGPKAGGGVTPFPFWNALVSSLPPDSSWIVGGALRDRLLKRPTRDLDIATLHPPKQAARRFAKKAGGVLFTLDEETRTYRVLISCRQQTYQIDFAQVLGKNIGEDLQRRDFTINAMALPLAQPRLLASGRFSRRLLDPLGGVRDAQKRSLRMTSPKVFPEDPLRLLRAFRIAAELDFRIEKNTLAAIEKHGPAIRKAAGERIREELLKLCGIGGSAGWFHQMDAVRLLTRIFPELESSRRCAMNYYPEGGVLGHSIRTVRCLEFLLHHLRQIYPKAWPSLRNYLDEPLSGYPRRNLLKLAALLHDIAKPATAKKIGGRLRFFGHDHLGSRMASQALKNLRFSNKEIELVSSITRHHLRPGNLAANSIVTDRAAYRFFRDVGECGLGLLLVCWADHASYAKKISIRPDAWTGNPKTDRHLEVVSLLLNRCFQKKEVVCPEKLVDGHDVIKTLNIPPGPQIRKILELIREAQASGRIRTSRQALDFLLRQKDKFVTMSSDAPN